MKQTDIDLSVVVAAYNEEPLIEKTVERLVKELESRPDQTWEIIVVNDGSRDRTGVLLNEMAAKTPGLRVLHHHRNFGQGRALRTAFRACRGRVIVTMDADLSYGPEYIFRLSDALEEQKVEITLASAYMKGGSIRNVPLYRFLLSRVANIYLGKMSRYAISTSTCVVRAYRREVLEVLPLTSDGMELQLEILMKASINGFLVGEVPAHLEWSSDKASTSTLRRASKMRILHTIQLYLLMGWLSRPAAFFMFFAGTLMLVGTYMAANITFNITRAVGSHLGEGVIIALSAGLKDVFTEYTYSIFFACTFLQFGLQLLAMSLLFLQNKFYYEEMNRSIKWKSERRSDR